MMNILSNGNSVTYLSLAKVEPIPDILDRIKTIETVMMQDKILEMSRSWHYRDFSYKDLVKILIDQELIV